MVALTTLLLPASPLARVQNNGCHGPFPAPVQLGTISFMNCFFLYGTKALHKPFDAVIWHLENLSIAFIGDSQVRSIYYELYSLVVQPPTKKVVNKPKVRTDYISKNASGSSRTVTNSGPTAASVAKSTVRNATVGIRSQTHAIPSHTINMEHKVVSAPAVQTNFLFRSRLAICVEKF